MKKALIFIGVLAFLALSFLLVNIGLLFYTQMPSHVVSVKKIDERTFVKAKMNYQVGHYDKAIAGFNEYLSFQKDNKKKQEKKIEILYYLGSSLMKRGEYTSFRLGDFSKERYYRSHEMAKQHFTDLMGYYDSKAVKHRDYYYKAILDYAEICRWYDQYDPFIARRLEEILHVVKGDGLASRVSVLLGYQYLFLNQFKQAMVFFLKSSGELSYLGKARVHIKLGEYPQAFRVYEDFIRYLPMSIHSKKVKETFLKQVYFWANQNYYKKRYSSAKEYYTKITIYFKGDRLHAEAMFKIGECYFRQRQYKKAIKAYRKVSLIGSSKFNDRALYQKALSQEKLGQLLQAYKSFSLLIESYKGSAYQARSRVWVQQLKNKLDFLDEEGGIDGK